jgi:hypothetical protein
MFADSSFALLSFVAGACTPELSSEHAASNPNASAENVVILFLAIVFILNIPFFQTTRDGLVFLKSYLVAIQIWGNFCNIF